jgi:ABC-type transport system involved in cytochrome bd biosynthesis fused ATPase/permease subunit
VALARAFCHAAANCCWPTKPTGNLDAATGAQVIDLMFAMNAEAGTTLILVTHDEALAHRCGRTLRLSRRAAGGVGAESRRWRSGEFVEHCSTPAQPAGYAEPAVERRRSAGQGKFLANPDKLN